MNPNDYKKALTAEDIIRMYDLGSLRTDRKKIINITNSLDRQNNIVKNFVTYLIPYKIQANRLTAWFFNGPPTLGNDPFINFSEEEKETRIGDVYYDRENGYGYQLVKEEDYQWVLIENDNLLKSLALANGEADTSDNQRNIYFEYPFTPYEIGDIWVDNNIIMRCRCARSEGEYNLADWIVQEEYSNELVLNDTRAILDQFIETVETEYTTKVMLETTKDSILGTVESTTNEINGRIKEMNATLEIHAGDIAMKLNSSDFTSAAVIGLINNRDGTSTAKIEATNIDLQGYVTITDLSGEGTTTIDGSNIKTGKIDTERLDASVITTNNLSAQTISANQIRGGTINGDYVSVTNLDASCITSGRISTSRLSTSVITASNLSAQSISASQITSGTMSADRIYGGTINGNNVSVTNLSAENITTGTFNASRFASNSISASKLNISSLSAISSNLGTITGGSININNHFSVNTSGGTQMSTDGGGFLSTRSTTHPYASALNVATIAGGGICFVSGTTQNSSGSAQARLFKGDSNYVYVEREGTSGRIESNSGTLSSRVLKENFVDFEDKDYNDAYDLLKQINIKFYDYKYKMLDIENKHQYGFIIDDLEHLPNISKFFHFSNHKAKIVNNSLNQDIFKLKSKGKIIDFKSYDSKLLDKFLLVCLKSLQQKIEELEGRNK